MLQTTAAVTMTRYSTEPENAAKGKRCYLSLKFKVIIVVRHSEKVFVVLKYSDEVNIFGFHRSFRHYC